MELDGLVKFIMKLLIIDLNEIIIIILVIILILIISTIINI
jgi:hypothetical protein